MARILITSGPTRQYLDPVRDLTNASSGRMGRALAAAGAGRRAPGDDRQRPGRRRTIRPRPRSISVVSTEEMLAACQELFPRLRRTDRRRGPVRLSARAQVEPNKIAKTGEPLELDLIETPDVVATLGARRTANGWSASRWKPKITGCGHWPSWKRSIAT